MEFVYLEITVQSVHHDCIYLYHAVTPLEIDRRRHREIQHQWAEEQADQFADLATMWLKLGG